MKAKLALSATFLAAALVAACAEGAGSTEARYEVTVRFGESVTQDDIDETADILRTFDEELDFVILEIFPPIGRAFLSTGEPDFCARIGSEIEARPYLNDVSCEEATEASPSTSPDEPVSSSD